jgi:hypothetical protein
MKVDFSKAFALLVLTFCLASSAWAQLFVPPTALMFDRGYDAYIAPANAKRVVIHRYIPGARFPGDFDVTIETCDYDPQGHLLSWKRFDRIMGTLLLESTYTWGPKGELLQERGYIANEKTEIQRNYKWEKDAQGNPTKAKITDKAGKELGSLEFLPDGTKVLTENGTVQGKVTRSSYDAKNRLVKVENTATLVIETYAYDDKGFLAKAIVNSMNGNTVIVYESKLDPDGKVVSQTETGKGAPKIAYFSYDGKGHIVMKGNSPKQPLEARFYNNLGHLTDILSYDPSGYPKEVLSISYETYP